MYTYADPSTGNRVLITDDGRLILSDTSYGQLILGLTTVAATGIVDALTALFPPVPGLPADAETPPEADPEGTPPPPLPGA